MQILQGQNEFSRIKLTLQFRKIHFLNQVMAQIFTATVIQTQVNVVWSLECKVQTDYEGMIDLFQDVDL